MVPMDFILATTSQVLMQGQADFPERLRWWRERRGLSQLELAGWAGLSQRHLSFLELGRASPSRQMVLRLAEALGLPLRQHNALLLAAGFAPAWRAAELGAPELAQVASAVDYMLAQQEPFPAVAVDRQWTLLKANTGAVRLVEFLVGPPPAGASVNLADALVAPDVLRPFLENWAEVVRYFIRSVEADAAADGGNETGALLDRLLAYKDVQSVMQEPVPERDVGPVLPMHFRKGETRLALFTAIATLGTPQNVTAQELRIESFFPMDERTAKVLRGWASPKRRTKHRR
jgi:transcriptional regulator with XRE-family HTH domain